MTVTGGTLTLTSADYKENGHLDNESDGPCPQVYSLPDTSGQGRNSGGIVARSLAVPQQWPANLDLARGRAVAAAVFSETQPAQPVVQLAISNGSAAPAPGAMPLQPGGHYLLRLTLAGQREPMDVPFVATAGGTGSLVVVRVD